MFSVRSLYSYSPRPACNGRVALWVILLGVTAAVLAAALCWNLLPTQVSTRQLPPVCISSELGQGEQSDEEAQQWELVTADVSADTIHPRPHPTIERASQGAEPPQLAAMLEELAPELVEQFINEAQEMGIDLQDNSGIMPWHDAFVLVAAKFTPGQEELESWARGYRRFLPKDGIVTEQYARSLFGESDDTPAIAPQVLARLQDCVDVSSDAIYQASEHAAQERALAMRVVFSSDNYIATPRFSLTQVGEPVLSRDVIAVDGFVAGGWCINYVLRKSDHQELVAAVEYCRYLEAQLFTSFADAFN